MKRWIHAASGDDSVSWQRLLERLEKDAQYGDPLYEQTDAGLELYSFVDKVDSELGVWAEPSVQGGMGGIWFYSAEDDHCVARGVDYESFNYSVLNIAFDSANSTEFKNKYRNFLESVLADHAVSDEDDEEDEEY